MSMNVIESHFGANGQDALRRRTVARTGGRLGWVPRRPLRGCNATLGANQRTLTYGQDQSIGISPIRGRSGESAPRHSNSRISVVRKFQLILVKISMPISPPNVLARSQIDLPPVNGTHRRGVPSATIAPLLFPARVGWAKT